MIKVGEIFLNFLSTWWNFTACTTICLCLSVSHFPLFLRVSLSPKPICLSIFVPVHLSTSLCLCHDIPFFSLTIFLSLSSTFVCLQSLQFSISPFIHFFSLSVSQFLSLSLTLSHSPTLSQILFISFSLCISISFLYVFSLNSSSLFIIPLCPSVYLSSNHSLFSLFLLLAISLCPSV